MPLTMGSGMIEIRAHLKSLTVADVRRLPAQDHAAADGALMVDSDEPLRLPWSGESGLLVLCGRGGCGGRLGYVRYAMHGQGPLWFPPEGFLERDGVYGLSKRAQAAYDRQRRARGLGELPKERHSHTPGPGRRRRPPSLETLDTGGRAFGVITVPRVMRPDASDRGLPFSPEGFPVRCPDCPQGRWVNILTPP